MIHSSMAMRRAACDGFFNLSRAAPTSIEVPQTKFSGMKAFLLAAGHGTRLRPLTETTPKCLLPIRGVPMLRIWLDLFRLHGIDEVLVNIHSHAHIVRAYLQSQDTDITVEVSEEPELLGSAGTLWANRAWIGS